MVTNHLDDIDDDVCPDCDSVVAFVPVGVCVDCGRIQVYAVVYHDATCPWMLGKL